MNNNVNFKTCLVTPEMAAEMLRHANPENRSISSKRVAEYANAMKSGRWQNNAECIQFREDGMLINGHHRLEAVIKANVPVEMSIATGLPDDVTLFDKGRPRSSRDTLTLCGINLPAKAISAVKQLYTEANEGKKATDDILIEYCERYGDELREARKIACSGVGHGIGDKTPFILAIYVAMRNQVSIPMLYEFAKIVNSGFYADEIQAPAIAFRNYLLGQRKNNPSAAHDYLVVALAAIHDYMYRNYKKVYRNNSGRSYMLIKVIREDKHTFEGW